MSPSSMQQTKLERLPLERFFQVGQLFASKAGDYPYSGTLNWTKVSPCPSYKHLASWKKFVKGKQPSLFLASSETKK